MSNDTELDFLKQIFEQVEIQPTVEFEFRLYHDEAGEPVCFSYEQLDMPHIVVEKSFYDAHILTGYKVIDGKIVDNPDPAKKLLRFVPNGNTLYAHKYDMQIPVTADTEGARGFDVD